jgi:hypothetical protein
VGKIKKIILFLIGIGMHNFERRNGIMVKRLFHRSNAVICVFFGGLLIVFSTLAQAAIVDITIDGSDAIFLAGRTDLNIPPASAPWPGGLIRHSSSTPEEIKETLPPIIPVSPGIYWQSIICTLPLTVEPFQFSPAEPVAYELSYQEC